MFPFINKKNTFILLLFSALNQLYNQNTHIDNNLDSFVDLLA